jgi:hypothetical protein
LQEGIAKIANFTKVTSWEVDGVPSEVNVATIALTDGGFEVFLGNGLLVDVGRDPTIVGQSLKMKFSSF